MLHHVSLTMQNRHALASTAKKVQSIDDRFVLASYCPSTDQRSHLDLLMLVSQSASHGDRG